LFKHDARILLREKRHARGPLGASGATISQIPSFPSFDFDKGTLRFARTRVKHLARARVSEQRPAGVRRK
jgi:hypothetical protein